MGVLVNEKIQLAKKRETATIKKNAGTSRK